MQFEFAILLWLVERHQPYLDTFMKAVTSLGNAGWFWIALGIGLLCFKKTRKTGFGMLLTLAVGFLLGNVVLKNLVARQRPCWLMPEIPLLIPVPSDYSFPSGHTLASVEGAVMLYIHHKKWGIVACVLAVLIAFSRMYLFVHFPTDILGGALLGIFNVWLVSQKIQPFLEKKWRKV